MFSLCVISTSLCVLGVFVGVVTAGTNTSSLDRCQQFYDDNTKPDTPATLKAPFAQSAILCVLREVKNLAHSGVTDADFMKKANSMSLPFASAVESVRHELISTRPNDLDLSHFNKIMSCVSLVPESGSDCPFAAMARDSVSCLIRTRDNLTEPLRDFSRQVQDQIIAVIKDCQKQDLPTDAEERDFYQRFYQSQDRWLDSPDSLKLCMRILSSFTVDIRTSDNITKAVARRSHPLLVDFAQKHCQVTVYKNGTIVGKTDDKDSYQSNLCLKVMEQGNGDECRTNKNAVNCVNSLKNIVLKNFLLDKILYPAIAWCDDDATSKIQSCVGNRAHDCQSANEALRCLDAVRVFDNMKNSSQIEVRARRDLHQVMATQCNETQLASFLKQCEDSFHKDNATCCDIQSQQECLARVVPGGFNSSMAASVATEKMRLEGEAHAVYQQVKCRPVLTQRC